jgi:ubiquinone/menaquinone biosynthesis C-methylase UbiE
MSRYRAIAEYYDAEYEGNPMLEQDVPFFLHHLPKRRQSVLELAAGTARAAIPIAQAGHRVVAVDYAKDMLAIARRKRDMVGLKEKDLELIHADALKLDLARTFDWVCMFFNTFLNFTTLEKQDAFLQAAHRHLKPGGRLWIDVFQPNLALLAQEESHGLDVVTFFVPALDRSVTRTTDVKRDPARQVQKITFNYDWYDEQGMHHHEELTFDLTFVFPRELQILLERNGFELERLYGNYDGSKVNADSPRMIACCRRGRMR